GAISPSAKERTTLRKSSCSGVKSRSIFSDRRLGPMKVWVSDGIFEEADARVSPLDHAILTGDGVFETLKVEAGVPFALRRHLERLSRSALGLGLDVPDLELVRKAVAEVLTANGLADGVVRITLTGGPAPLGSERGTAGPTLIVAAAPPRGWGPTAAVGVTPQLLLELGVAEEADLNVEDLRRTDEAFITSSTRDVHPVSAVDGNRLPAAPGPLTTAARKAFRDLCDRDPDP